MTSFRKCHLLEPEKFKPQLRLKPALEHWWQARKADVLTITPCIAPRCAVCVSLHYTMHHPKMCSLCVFPLHHASPQDVQFVCASITPYITPRCAVCVILHYTMHRSKMCSLCVFPLHHASPQDVQFVCLSITPCIAPRCAVCVSLWQQVTCCVFLEHQTTTKLQ